MTDERMCRCDVLVVDDDDDIREIFGLVLESSGYHVATASNGAAALATLRAGCKPSVILLDLMMPGMNGTEFRDAQLSDPALASIPVVVVSGDGHLTAKASQLGLCALKKPIDRDHLVGVAERYCGAPH